MAALSRVRQSATQSTSMTPIPRPQFEELSRAVRLPLSTTLGIVAAMLIVASTAYVTYLSLRARESAAARATHSQAVVEQIGALRASLADAETGQRGYLLTGEERYVEPYLAAQTDVPTELRNLRNLLIDNPDQLRRIDGLEQLTADKLGELDQTIALRRAGSADQALAIVRSDRGRLIMDRIRGVLDAVDENERLLLAAHQADWQRLVTLSSVVTWGGSVVLLGLIVAATIVMSRDYRARQRSAWMRLGEVRFAQAIQGQQHLDRLGDVSLAFLADYLGAQVGAIYLVEGPDRLRRFAGYALDPASNPESVRTGQGLLGQAVKQNVPLHVAEVPAGYLTVASSLGRTQPTDLLIAPAAADGTAYAALELGFFRRVQPEEAELLGAISNLLGAAVRAARDRDRVEALLSETQNQAEELQTQQEELRVSNEELEEQSRLLTSSQANLELQQVELEQVNANLEEQTQLLEHQKDELSLSQVTLIEKAAELARANQYKSEFLANMSHELRTPLNSSLILAKLLSDNKGGNLTPEQVRFADTILSAGNDLLALINDILDLSKIEAGRVELINETVNIRELIDALGVAIQPMAVEKQLAFTFGVAAGTPTSITTDGQKLGQILKNLLSNAFKFTSEGQVSLTANAAGNDQIAFVVSDTGIGIPHHQQHIIFDAFRQADGSTHRKYGGTGLGLSISRDLARLLGGTLTVESTPDHGSIFTLTLPLAGLPAAAAPEDGPMPVTPVPPTSAGVGGRAAALPVADDRARLVADTRRILVIEDDDKFASILQDLAHEKGFQCIVAHTADDGLAAVMTYQPAAILLDVNLPDRSGLGVLDQLKRQAETRHIPIHVLSVTDHEQEALRRGAVGYALKPIDRERLMQAFQKIETTLEQRLHHVLVVEDDARQRESITELLGSNDIAITAVASGGEALAALTTSTFDCMVMDLKLPDVTGFELLERMASRSDLAFPPVIVYTGRSLTLDEERRLNRFSKSIIIKGARSPERLLDEVTLFLHQVEATLPPARQRMLRIVRDRDTQIDGRRVLIVEDDARNIFALSSVLEQKGARVEIARNGREALDVLARCQATPDGAVDLVLMDIMMPEMDGLAATREIRTHPEWKKLPIIALTAKAMQDDQEHCLAAGANDYAAKPLDVERLLSLIRVWMPK